MSKASTRTLTIARAADPAAPPVSCRCRSTVTRPATGGVDNGTGRRGIRERHDVAGPHVREAVGVKPRNEVGRPVVERRRPDVRLSPERRKEDESLGQATIERVGADRPADGLEPVPERLAVRWVMQQDRVAQITELPPGRGVDLRFVEKQPAQRRGVDGWQARRLGDRRSGHRAPRYRARSKATAGSSRPAHPTISLIPGTIETDPSPRPERCIPVADDASDHPGQRAGNARAGRTAGAGPGARAAGLRPVRCRSPSSSLRSSSSSTSRRSALPSSTGTTSARPRPRSPPGSTTRTASTSCTRSCRSWGRRGKSRSSSPSSRPQPRS